VGTGAVRRDRPSDWRAVLFDLDGTLADSVPLILHCFRHTMLKHLGRKLPDELWIGKIGLPLRTSMAEFAADQAETERMVTTYTEFQKTVHDDMVGSFPEAGDTLAALRSRGVPVGIVTSKGREMTERTLAQCGFGDLAVLVTVDDVVCGKPDPEPVTKALTLLGLGESARDVLFVGDSTYDMVAGRDAGVRTAGALWGPYSRADLEGTEPDYWVEDFAAVLALRPCEY
jgi:pyrophosphatase PpaX